MKKFGRMLQKWERDAMLKVVSLSSLDSAVDCTMACSVDKKSKQRLQNSTQVMQQLRQNVKKSCVLYYFSIIIRDSSRFLLCRSSRHCYTQGVRFNLYANTGLMQGHNSLILREQQLICKNAHCRWSKTEWCEGLETRLALCWTLD